MKNLTKLILILAFAGMMPFQSCDSWLGSDIGCGAEHKKFEVDQMSAQVILLHPPYTIPADSIPRQSDSLAVALRVENIRYVMSPRQEYPLTFTGSAYACSPAIPSAENSIGSVTLTAANAFQYSGKTYAAGDTINELFIIVKDYYYISEYESIETYLKENDRIKQHDRFLIKLKNRAVENQLIRLSLSVRLSNNVIFEVNDLQLNLKP